MDVNDQLHAPNTLPAGEESVCSTHQLGGWVGFRAGLDAVATRKITAPTNHRSAVSQPVI
jgi:hypothetical protein